MKPIKRTIARVATETFGTMKLAGESVGLALLYMAGMCFAMYLMLEALLALE